MRKNRRIPTQGAARLAALALLVGIGLAACGGGSSMPPPTVSISVQPDSIVLGQSASIAWSSSQGTNCSASGGWSGTEPTSGTLSVTPTAIGVITYTLMCSGGSYSGSATQSASLTVTAPSAYSFTRLVADTAAGAASTTDANLVNPWGIAFGTTSPVWVANNGTGTSTVYDGNGVPQPTAAPRVVGLNASASGVDFDPTGIVFNPTTDFVVSVGGTTGPAAFIFDGEGGMIAGWPASVGLNSAVTMYLDAGGAVYKGLAIANNGSGNFLYATDFHNNKIDVFDATFQRQTPSDTQFSFKDPTLPAGYAPFGIQAIKNGPGGTTQIYVTYAQKATPDDVDETDGPGLGLIDVFDANGNLISHLVAPGGVLNAPWGIALAPSDFGTLSGALLVGNFGDGRINGFDPATGAFVGTISDASGTAFAMPGLWGIAFGNDANSQPHNTLFFAAGINDEADGAYGRIDLGSAPPQSTTLAQIQASVFTPICSGCHDGSQPPGGALPGSQNLTDGNSFASLVNVPSQEQPGLLRVKPGDPANSYLIRKLEGEAGISGSRMPLGGPFLDQATIDKIKSWIAAGAANN